MNYVEGGACWSNVNSAGRCKEILSQGVTREQCCNGANAPETSAYSEEDYDNGALFFWQVLGGGVKCDSCRASCDGVRCADGRRCVLRRGMPKCVCRPECREPRAIAAGPVCGTDGRTYRSLCKLKRRICRKGFHELAVAYGGQCRSSCAGVRCRHGRSCLLDQNLSAHCVKCSRRCSLSGQQRLALRPVCGVDGNTYKSACHLRAAACRAGRAIAIAYRGPCRKYTDCTSVQCRPGQLCLAEPHTDRPRCVTCLYRCPRNKELIRERNRHRNRDYQDPSPIALCATNNITYPSWCHIMKDACLTGLVLETRHAGPCQADDPAPFHNSNNSSSDGFGKGSGDVKQFSLKKDLRQVIGKSRLEESKSNVSKENVPSIL
ncbi:PREDICTED: follistatin-A isoform X2 [Ceratosolen solmsi marchali]|uniref:Follistatin-A isoform X2 n=1 Tax=Ceratosolen solmsi marchali TaxID=326594 RepID=A0AAJ6YTW6_9HYME|nr:PREDICTED: follistatin-A isoform X2 [Ceratosolen solmsi marchali]